MLQYLRTVKIWTFIVRGSVSDLRCFCVYCSVLQMLTSAESRYSALDLTPESPFVHVGAPHRQRFGTGLLPRSAHLGQRSWKTGLQQLFCFQGNCEYGQYFP